VPASALARQLIARHHNEVHADRNERIIGTAELGLPGPSARGHAESQSDDTIVEAHHLHFAE